MTLRIDRGLRADISATPRTPVPVVFPGMKPLAPPAYIAALDALSDLLYHRCVGAFGRPCLMLTDAILCERCWGIVDAAGREMSGNRPGLLDIAGRHWLTRKGHDASRHSALCGLRLASGVDVRPCQECGRDTLCTMTPCCSCTRARTGRATGGDHG